ncbi:hypothetical protein ILYODFUR_009518 [Ilyodon furcidens]|uniref:Uncharacterized protein n=1 Tax=Ilyodon furcidens TaxID=33524 RepID=A0ABV0VCI7_9TELE
MPISFFYLFYSPCFLCLVCANSPIPSRPSFSCFSVSVQLALAEEAALTEIQMAAFEGTQQERQLIRPFTRPKKIAVQLLLAVCCICIVPCLYPLSSCRWIGWILQRFRER